jgi:hypothetical protein
MLGTELVPVRVLATEGAVSAVEPLGEATLAAGDSVVVVGVDRIFPGALVVPRDLGPRRGGPAPAGETAAASKSP